MKIVFRTDASIEIGSGHVMRCLTLANELKKNNHKCIFICREHIGNLIDKITSFGHDILILPTENEEDDDLAHSKWLGATQLSDVQACLSLLKKNNTTQIDWLIVDHYGLDVRWQTKMRTVAQRIMVIDDLHDRNHDCDLLLDQNLGSKVDDYISIVPEHCETLIGPKYALLRPEFAKLREYSLQRRQESKLENILITLGGVDKDNVTGNVLSALKNANLPIETKVKVVMGSTAPHIETVKKIASTMPYDIEVLVNISDMAQRMADADIAIGAAGSSSWERCCLGLPTLMFVLAENQRIVAKFLEKQKVAIAITNVNQLTNELISEAFSFRKNILKVVSGNGLELVIRFLEGPIWVKYEN